MDQLQLASGAAASVADQNEDRGSCSCIEGNPCVEPLCCKDWANRFQVAARIRGEMGRFALPPGVIDTLNTDMATGGYKTEKQNY